MKLTFARSFFWPAGSVDWTYEVGSGGKGLSVVLDAAMGTDIAFVVIVLLVIVSGPPRALGAIMMASAHKASIKVWNWQLQRLVGCAEHATPPPMGSMTFSLFILHLCCACMVVFILHLPAEFQVQVVTGCDQHSCCKSLDGLRGKVMI